MIQEYTECMKKAVGASGFQGLGDTFAGTVTIILSFQGLGDTFAGTVTMILSFQGLGDTFAGTVNMILSFQGLDILRDCYYDIELPMTGW